MVAKVELFALFVPFSYYEISRKITITFDKNTIGMASLKMSKGLAELLGFEYSKLAEIVLPIKEKNTSINKKSQLDIANNLNLI